MLREDKLLLGCQRYIGESLGAALTQGQPWTLEGVLPDTTALRPVIFILTSGADPTAMLQVTMPDCTSCITLICAHTPNRYLWSTHASAMYIYSRCMFCVPSAVLTCAPRT